MMKKLLVGICLLFMALPAFAQEDISRVDKDKAKLLCIDNNLMHIIFEHHRLKGVHDADGTKIPITNLGHGLYELKDIKQGKIYDLQLRKISTKRR